MKSLNLKIKKHFKLAIIGIICITVLTIILLRAFSSPFNQTNNTYVNLLESPHYLIPMDDFLEIKEYIESMRNYSLYTCPVDNICSDYPAVGLYIDESYKLVNVILDEYFLILNQIENNKVDDEVCLNYFGWLVECLYVTPSNVHEIWMLLIDYHSQIKALFESVKDDVPFEFHNLLGHYNTLGNLTLLSERSFNSVFLTDMRISYEALQRIYTYKILIAEDHDEALYLTALFILDYLGAYADEYLMYLINAEQASISHILNSTIEAGYVFCLDNNNFSNKNQWDNYYYYCNNYRELILSDWLIPDMWSQIPIDSVPKSNSIEQVSYRKNILALHLGLLECTNYGQWDFTLDFFDINNPYCEIIHDDVNQLLPAAQIQQNLLFRRRLPEILRFPHEELFTYFYDYANRRRYSFNYFKKNELEVLPGELHQTLSQITGFASSYTCQVNSCLINYYTFEGSLLMPFPYFQLPPHLPLFISCE